MKKRRREATFFLGDPRGERPRASCLFSLLGHALHACTTGAVASTPPVLRGAGVCVGLRGRSGLGVWVARPRGGGASKAAGIPPFLRRRSGGGGEGKARRRLTDFYPLAASC
jgi:hypothetical protein